MGISLNSLVSAPSSGAASTQVAEAVETTSLKVGKERGREALDLLQSAASLAPGVGTKVNTFA